MADILKKELTIFKNKLLIAFIFGSFAKQVDTSTSDIDIILIGTDLTYSDFFHILESSEKRLGRKINPYIYTPEEWFRKRGEGNNFIGKVMEQPKIFLIGSDNELAKFGEPGQKQSTQS